jgi:hypothetical protein
VAREHSVMDRRKRSTAARGWDKSNYQRTEHALRGVGLATLLRDLATEAAHEARRTRIRQASAAIGARVATLAEAHAFYEGWGTPQTDAS